MQKNITQNLSEPEVEIDVLSPEEVEVGGFIVSRCSLWSQDDMAKDVLNKNYRRLPVENRPSSVARDRVYLMDGENKNFPTSWEALVAAHPEYIGQHVRLHISATVR